MERSRQERAGGKWEDKVRGEWRRCREKGKVKKRFEKSHKTQVVQFRKNREKYNQEMSQNPFYGG